MSEKPSAAPMPEEPAYIRQELRDHADEPGIDEAVAYIDALRAEAERLRGEVEELHGVMKFLVDTVHKAMGKYRGK